MLYEETYNQPKLALPEPVIADRGRQKPGYRLKARA
jgi:hypothetical protein